MVGVSFTIIWRNWRWAKCIFPPCPKVVAYNFLIFWEFLKPCFISMIIEATVVDYGRTIRVGFWRVRCCKNFRKNYIFFIIDAIESFTTPAITMIFESLIFICDILDFLIYNNKIHYCIICQIIIILLNGSGIKI